MTKSHEADTHWYPASVAGKRPTPWWYWGRALYVSRGAYWKITKYLLAVGSPRGAIGVLVHGPMGLVGAMVVAVIGLVLLAYSLFGLYRMYGHPALRYIRRLVDLGGLRGEITVADLHIGTYRHAFLLSDALPEATVQTVDCWNVEGESPEEAVQDVRDLEVPPTSNPRIVPSKADHFTVPLPDEVVGLGRHNSPVTCRMHFQVAHIPYRLLT